MLAFDGGALGFRNKIINGDGNIAQRASSAALGATVSYVSMDRWAARQTGTPNAALYKNTTVIPSGFSSAMQLYRPSSSTATGVLELLQALDSVNSIPLQGGTVTLSFYAKAGATFSASGSNIGVSIFASTGTDQGAASMGGWTGATQPINVTQSITTTWTRYTFSGTIPSTTTQLGLYINWTPTGTAGADDGLYITGVQLEKGPTATPFEYRPYGLEALLCYRYYWRYVPENANEIIEVGQNETTTRSKPIIKLPVPMRIAPVVSTSGAATFNLRGSTTNVTCSSFSSAVAQGPSRIAIEANTATAHGGAAGGACLFCANTTASWFDASAEL